MKLLKISTFVFSFFLPLLVFAESAALETGYFKDEKGFVDESTNQVVADAQNIMGHRYIGIELNMQGSKIKDVQAFDKQGNAIETGAPLNVSTATINGVEQKNAYLKIWLKMPEGTSFKLVYTFK